MKIKFDQGRLPGMPANSGCVRNCPWQVFHEGVSFRPNRIDNKSFPFFSGSVEKCDAPVRHPLFRAFGHPGAESRRLIQEVFESGNMEQIISLRGATGSITFKEHSICNGIEEMFSAVWMEQDHDGFHVV